MGLFKRTWVLNDREPSKEASVESFRDEADAADERRETEKVQQADPEVPEADALEQASDLRRPAEEEPNAVGDRPEADALEQARGVEDDGDEDDRR